MDVKAKVIALIKEGGFSKARAEERYGVATRTASRWWAQYQERGYITRSGRKTRGINTTTKSYVNRTFEALSFHTSKMLVAGTEFPASNRTASKRLNSANIVQRRSAVKEVLTEDH
ncbi:hypothetical protein ANN_17709 [Periplaneta americana]|uniref:Uncharacterized protein n=1 Tax=Periplaneta americana TaxID=6978 RepID=A0ABQ8STQ6_PERAM|nr:hypothetical protein ANN_17709 [Periplaneta americana]